MSRVQLALNVSNIDEAVTFYSAMFGVEPAKRRPGYANFAVVDPPLKLVLIENAEVRGHGTAFALNHLGVELATSDEVKSATARLSGAGLATTVEDETACCYALQDKVWVDDPNGAPWEYYTVLADAPEAGFTTIASDAEQGCCSSASVSDSPAEVSQCC